MAKRTTKAREDADELPELLEAEQPALDSAGIENLLHQLGELTGEAKVHVYRVRQGIRPPFAFLFATTAAQFAIEDVQARYGGGDYFVKAWQRGVSGSLVNERFAIEGEPIVQRPAPVAIANPTPGAPPIMMLPGGQGDAISALAGMFTSAIDRLAATLQAAQPRGRDLKETLELLTIAKSLAAPASAAPDVLGLLSNVMGIMREAQPITGEGGKADVWSLMQSAVDKVLPAIIERTALLPATPALPGPTAPAFPGLPRGVVPAPLAPSAPGSLAEAARLASENAPQAAPGAPGAMIAPAPAAQAVRTDPAVTATLGAYAAMFVQAAMIGADPADYAANVVDMIDANPQAEPAVRAFLARPDWIEELSRQAPAVAPHRAWFARLGADVLSQLDAPAEPPADEEEGADPERAHFAGS